MLPTKQGSIRLFRFLGIDIFLHWSWFLVGIYEVNNRRGDYSSLTWNILEYLALFCIILMHEFGHALACRQVGGKANQIVLWPLGGVAYVAPPPRPGATLWSIAAGPLVNVVLAPPLTLLVVLGSAGWAAEMPNAYGLIHTICMVNYFLLAFNLLPIFPLDGGQILRSLLWFGLGRARSLMVATMIGFVGVAGLIGLAVFLKSYWIALVAAFILMNCWRGLSNARMLARAAKLPRHPNFACPSCKEHPIRAPMWRCAKCLKNFDTFDSMASCPNCGTNFPVTQCFECGQASPIQAWTVPLPVVTAASPASPGNAQV